MSTHSSVKCLDMVHWRAMIRESGPRPILIQTRVNSGVKAIKDTFNALNCLHRLSMLFIITIGQLQGAFGQLIIDMVGFFRYVLPKLLEKAAPLIFLLDLFRCSSYINRADALSHGPVADYFVDL